MIAFFAYLTIILRLAIFLAVLYGVVILIFNPYMIGEFVASIINGFNGRIA